MKKKILIIFMLIMSGLFLEVNGCSKKSIVDMQIIRIGQGLNYTKDALGTKIIKNGEELNYFIIENCAKFVLSVDSSSYSDGTISFIQAAKKYGTEFFKNHYLALYIFDCASSSKYKFQKAEVLDDSLEIYVKNISGNYSSCDVDFRLFIAEIPYNENIKNINFNFI